MSNQTHATKLLIILLNPNSPCRFIFLLLKSNTVSPLECVFDPTVATTGLRQQIEEYIHVRERS